MIKGPLTIAFCGVCYFDDLGIVDGEFWGERYDRIRAARRLSASLGVCFRPLRVCLSTV